MSVFSELKQQLIQQLDGLPQDSKWHTVSVDIGVETDMAEAENPLAWLKGQTVFPHYFWQHRKEPFTLTAIGAAKWFADLNSANQFSLEQNVYVLGGVEFEGKPSFFLPRLLLVKNGSNLTACCYLKGDEIDGVRQFLQSLNQPEPLCPLNHTLCQKQSAYDPSHWAADIEQIIQRINEQQFDKVVLANATTLTLDRPISAYDLLAASQQKNQGCFHFLWSENGSETFVGSSPERLYHRQGRDFFTEALAGTAAVNPDPIQTEQNALWLLNDHKNIYENWLVVDDICNHLADCAADIQVGDAEIKRLRNVQHLRRKIHTVLADKVTDADCLSRIHPTAAVAGLPRQTAKQFIMQHENFVRGWYAGTLGYFHPTAAEFCVTLRSARIQGKQITLYAGAGIVAESDPQSEWLEIERKAQAMLSLITG